MSLLKMLTYLVCMLRFFVGARLLNSIIFIKNRCEIPLIASEPHARNLLFLR